MILSRRSLLAATAALAAPNVARAQANAPIRIGEINSYSAAPGFTVPYRNGWTLAVEQFNAAGGVLGKKIELVLRDDEAKNERGVEIAQEFINNTKVVAAVGYINTGVALASQRFFQEAKIPVINNVATGTLVTHQFDKEPDNFVFRNAAADVIQAPMIVEEAVTRRGFKKVAILADSTAYGDLGRKDLTAALESKGVTPVASEKFNIKDTDMTAQLLKAKEAGAEVILTYAIGPELASIANSMAKIGWKKPMIGSWTLSMANFIDTAGKNGNGAMMPQTFIQDPNTPTRKAFIDDYLKEFKPKKGRIDSPVSAAQGYDSIYLLAAAIKQAGGTDGVKIKEALENLSTPVNGVVTVYNKPFTKTDHEAITSNIPLMGEVKEGRVTYANEADAKANPVRVKNP